MGERVVILGASDKPERFAHRAFRLLREHGHVAVPVHPVLEEIEGVPVLASLEEVGGPVDTLTVYVNPAVSAGLAAAIVGLGPGRVIFNPGTESAALQAALDRAGVPWVEDCTLVILENGRF